MTNIGILSACLPTLRPLYEGYRLNSVTSRFTAFTTYFSGARSRTRSIDNIRLNPVEHGFTDFDSKGTHSQRHEPYTAYHDPEFSA